MTMGKCSGEIRPLEHSRTYSDTNKNIDKVGDIPNSRCALFAAELCRNPFVSLTYMLFLGDKLTPAVLTAVLHFTCQCFEVNH